MNYPNDEIGLLVACIKSHFDENNGHANTIRTSVTKDIDWEYLWRLAYANDVTHLFWCSNCRLDIIDIPMSTALKFQKAYDLNSSINILILIELKKILTLFEKNNIKTIVFKGITISGLYDNIFLRETCDIDIIIHNADLKKIMDLFNADSYRIINPASGSSLQEIISGHKSCTFVNKDGSLEIDVHWSFVEPWMKIAFPMDQIWNGQRQLILSGIDIPALSIKDTILSLCIHHGLRNGWNRLKFICDITVVLNANKTLDWMEMINYAEQIKVKKSFLVGIVLAHHLFGFTIPIQISALVKDSTSKRIALIVLKRIFENRDNKKLVPLTDMRVKFLIRDNLYLKLVWIKSLLIIAVVPAESDKKFIHLPRYLYFIYYFVRPIRIFRKYIPLLFIKELKSK
jgi:hypothetical protein